MLELKNVQFIFKSRRLIRLKELNLRTYPSSNLQKVTNKSFCSTMIDWHIGYNIYSILNIILYMYSFQKPKVMKKPKGEIKTWKLMIRFSRQERFNYTQDICSHSSLVLYSSLYTHTYI